MTASKKLITAIITRTRNRPLLLERAIKSILAQTEKDYIHVILNDGGDKKEVEDILARYPDHRRRVVHNKTSVGITRALNQAIQSVDSDLVAILDDDDTWMPERIERVTAYFESNPRLPAIAVKMDRVIEEINDNKIKEIRRDPWYEGICQVSLYDQLLDNYLTNNCLTYRRDVYDELHGYDESLEVAEDWDFGVRLLLEYDVDFIPEVLALYHHRPDEKSSNGNSVFAGIDIHQRNLIKLRNRYLRQDIEKGVCGVGYIMNSLHHERLRLKLNNEYIDKQSVRLEGHMNRNTEAIKEALYDNTGDIRSTIEKTSLYRVIKNKLKLGKKG